MLHPAASDETLRTIDSERDVAAEAIPPAPRRHLPRLTAARFFAAIAVFTFHAGQIYGVTLRPLTTLGYAGVSFFFILSGFVLTWTAADRVAAASFYRRRFARIYPPYALVLVLVGVVGFAQAPTHEVATTLCAVFLVQAWLANSGIYAINPPAWSLSVEMAFYLSMPLLHRRLVALGSRRRWAVALGWFAGWALFAALATRVGGNWSTAAFANPLGHGAEFVLGIVAALALREGRRLGLGFALLISVSSIAACWLAGGRAPLPAIELDPLFLVLIVGLAQADLTGRRGSVLTRRSLGYLGAISFEFYLVHQFVLERVLGLGLYKPAGIALSLVLGLCASAALFEFVQRPFERLLGTGSRARLVRVGLVVGSAVALVVPLAVLPRRELPVRTATISLRAAITSGAGEVEHVSGTEWVDFSAPAPSAAGRFAVTGPRSDRRIDERAVGGALYSRAVAAASGDVEPAWAKEPVSAGHFPGRPDDDPAHLLERLSQFGPEQVVAHPKIGDTTVTKLRIPVVVSRLTRAELSAFSLTSDADASVRLTVWVLVDPDHLVRQLQYRDELANPTGKYRATVTATYSLAGFNEAIPVSAVLPHLTIASGAGNPLMLTLFT